MPTTKHTAPDDLVDRRTAAKILHVSQATLCRWMVERFGPPAIKLADGTRGRVLYRRDDIEAFLDARTIHSKS
jgi:hypothetical protein